MWRGDHVQIGAPQLPSDGVDHRAPPQRVDARAIRRADHELGGAFGCGEFDQGAGDVVAHDLVVATAESNEKLALGREFGICGVEHADRGCDVHTDELTVAEPREPCRSSDRAFVAWSARDGHHDPLAGLPLLGDAVRVHVAEQRRVEPVGHPEK
ncbi:unannotated protein [freshwater metagenome]|uniref:Unannotated protein n=1 Tax=freshwater metagenome TaxID=449393 RepID=A0A6J7QGZ9_9ZZZZ